MRVAAIPAERREWVRYRSASYRREPYGKKAQIDVVEAAYRLDEVEETAWISELGRVFTEVSGLRTTGAFTYELANGFMRLHSIWDVNVRDITDLRALHDGLPIEQCEMLYGRALMASSLRERLSEMGVSLDAMPAGPVVAKAGGYDIFGLPGVDIEGHGVALSGVTGRERPSTLEMHKWSVAEHVACAYVAPGAGRRSGERRRGGGAHAGREARARIRRRCLNARERLRDAVRRVDRARRPSIGEEESFDLWQGLVDGRWSIVDHFVSGSRRHYVVVRNPPKARSVRELTLAERTALGYVVGGTSNKIAAYALGQSESAYSRVAHRAMRKLGVRTRAALIELAGRIGSRGPEASADVDVAALEVSGVELPVVSFPQIPCPETFTEAEREVACMVAAGTSNAEIARRRVTSERTVANQLASIYRKCRVATREELVVALLKRPTS